MKNFVISLNSALDRREHIKCEFSLKNVTFEFFDAIQPYTLEKAENEFDLSLANSKLTENEKSCFMSHFVLWNRAVTENLDYIAIFEDDIYLSDSSDKFLNSSDWLDVEIIKIEKTTKSVLIKNKVNKEFKGNKFILGELKSSHMGAGGYILSLKAVKSLIDFVKEQKTLDHVDQIIFDWYRNQGEYKVFQLSPVLCIQDCILYPKSQKFQTSLQWRDKKKAKMEWWKKINRELIRVIVKLIELPYKVSLTFKGGK